MNNLNDGNHDTTALTFIKPKKKKKKMKHLKRLKGKVALRLAIRRAKKKKG